MEIFKNILKGISIAVGVLLLVVFLIGTIGFSAWLTATAKHEYVTDTVYCMDKYRHGTSNMVSSNADCSQRLKSWGSQNLMENNIHLDMFRLRTNLRN